MSLLSPNPVPSGRLHWDAPSRKFVGEMSEIGGFGRVYDDACDEGLTLVSRYPGRPAVVFAVDHEERDRDGDTLYWDLKPADLRQRSIGFTIRIFND